jgi:hypothetical protein
MTIMKRMLFLAAVVALTSAGTGCNRAWPGYFCRDNDFNDYSATDACQPCDPCDPYGVAYSTAPGVEYLQPSAPVVRTETLPLPGPATTTAPVPAPAPAR